MSALLQPLRAGELTLRNRIVMSPLTRCRAIDRRVPNSLMRDYYVQRATTGMILSEATAVTPMGVGYPHTPGIWSDEQVEAWRTITDACIEVWAAGRVGMHLAPRGDASDVGDSDPKGTFGYLCRELGQRKIAFLCLREHEGEDWLTPYLKQEFGGVVIGNEGFTQASAEAALARGDVDAVAFGKLIIANPDLVARFEGGAPLNEWNTTTFYAHGAEGYTDYPALA